MHRPTVIGSALAAFVGIVATAANAYAGPASPVSVDISATTSVPTFCVWGTPAPGSLGRSSDNKGLSTTYGAGSAAGAVTLYCNGNFTLTLSQPIATTPLAAAFLAQATSCQTSFYYVITNNSCTTAVSGNFSPFSSLIQVNITVQGPNIAPSGSYGYKVTATASPL